VFLLGLTLAKSQILFWDTERIRLFYFSTTIGTPPPFSFIARALSVTKVPRLLQVSKALPAKLKSVNVLITGQGEKPIDERRKQKAGF